ncbi:MAG: cryptochrome/photolyase family protein, partial [Pseudomonadota bacterium]
MGKLRLVLGDQLHRNIAALSDIDKKNDIVLMAEVMGEATYVKHHQQKIVFLFSAMRHFAKALKAEKINIRYVTLDDRENTGSLLGEVKRCLSEEEIDEVIVTACG